MATVVLQYAGAALGTLLGGPIGGMIGRAVGGLLGAEVDQALFAGGTSRQGPRLNSLQVMASQEGAAIPVIYGRMRVAGQVIWATNLLEVASTTGGGGLLGGKGGAGSGNQTTTYSYFANFAVGLCEGPILSLGRCWADGKEIDLNTFSPRIYLGDEAQQPDSFISSIEGADVAPAYRGLAYIVFERMPLQQFGNRLPQLSFEIFAKGNEAAGAVRAVNIIPGATEFGYETALVTRSGGVGVTVSENTHASAVRSDWSVSLDQLQATCANAGMASLVVSWFGNDLRCDHCRVMPGTDNPAKVVSGANWTVSGIDRSAAHAVSTVGGAPAYGGTPSDQSVLNAIADLKARGLKVMFYPFLLMDIPVGNAAGQPAYPWRGRISGTDMSASAASDVAAFMGTATPAQFTSGAGTVNFAGSEWTYRRMILHYAKLCALAGGVEAFLIGSELRGLTTLRSAVGTYPFVTALQQLASDVKAILPNAKISYAADWSEYFGHQPADGSKDVYFHLDPLWASANVDFIGIDNYFPLTDWRDGLTHRDLIDGARSIYDRAYLAARVAGGEDYHWFYATAADRDAQVRTPISDGAYNKAWVFRPKDIKNWWSKLHYNRPHGVEAASPTSWVPQSKPIWFTEIGCPAVDKGSNAPNDFYDAKSSESILPPYSDGRPDKEIQLAYIFALSNYWSVSGAQNPVSTVYGAPMVAADKMFWWCWDARPYPAFPARDDVWADGANYARGHWLNGRMAGVSLASLITALAARFGFTAIDCASVEGVVDGFMLDKPMSARAALQSLLETFSIDCVESAGVLKFVSRDAAPITALDNSFLIDDEKASPLITLQRAQETDLPAAVHLAYSESDLDYRQGAVSQQRSGTSSKAETAITLSASVSQAVAQERADVVLAEAWTGRENAKFALPPSLTRFEPSDVLAVDGNLWRLKILRSGVARSVEALAHDPACYDPPQAPQRGVAAASPAILGQAEVVMMDLALVDGTGSSAPRLAAQATPWPGSLAVFRRAGTGTFGMAATLPQAAALGKTLTALTAGVVDRVDWNQTLDVVMHAGALSSVSRDDLLSGANIAALGDAASGFEVIQFQNAALVAADTYRLSGLLRAQAGSLPEMLPQRGAGQNFVLLNAAVIQPNLTDAQAAQGAEWRVGPASRDYGDPSYVDFNFQGTLRALRPLAPTYLRLSKVSGGFQLTWIRRTRTDGDSWDMSEVPLAEASEAYQLDIVNNGVVLRSVSTAAPSYLYASADAAADFGGAPSTITARVAQMSATLGKGAVIERSFNV